MKKAFILLAAFLCLCLSGCAPAADIQEPAQPVSGAPASVDVSGRAEALESAPVSELSAPSQIAEILEKACAVVDDGTFYAAVVDCYSDTHLTEMTVRLGRLDGEPADDDYTPVGELTEPDFYSGLFDEVAKGKYGDSSWYEDGAYFIRYRVYTRPAHTEISLSYAEVDWTPVELTLTFKPEPAPRKTAGEMKFDDGMEVDSALAAGRSGIVTFYLPESQAVTRETDENGNIHTSRGLIPVSLSILDADGGVLCEKEGSIGSTGNDREAEGYYKYAFHFFFDEDDPLPLDEAASIVLNGNEIPLTPYPE